jgi:serine/threonine-protein kinase
LPGRDSTPERGPAGPAADAVRGQLTRILGSQAFAHAPMLRRLLRHVVEHTLDGAQELKEYAVGVDVFDRGPEFDPRTDTIVRVQARRLRAKLDDYYRSEGAADAVLIELPKGRYLAEWRTKSATGEPAPAIDAEPSIVVLPFVNLNADPETEFLTDGLTEELIGTLASVVELKVVARTSAFHFKGRTEDIREIGRKLGVRTALEGSVRIHQQRMRVMAQLIDLANGLHLWSESYDRTLGAVFDIQEEIARAIVDALQLRLAPAEHARLRTSASANADARDHYLKGRYFWHRNTPPDLQKCVEHLERAVALDPAYASAHAGLSDAYMLLLTHQAEAPESFVQKARRAAERAVALENSAEAHSAMGMLLSVGEWNFKGAEHEFRRALDLKPSFAFAHMAYAVCCLCPLRRYGSAVEQLQASLELDPLSIFTRVMLGQTLILHAEHDAAIKTLELALELDPAHLFGHVTLALAYIARGRHREAVARLENLGRPGEEFPNCLGHLGYARGILGDRAGAERVLHMLLERFPGPWAPSVDVAAVHNGLGDTAAAVQWLERARRDRSFDSLFVLEDPRFANLRTMAGTTALVSHPGA